MSNILARDRKPIGEDLDLLKKIAKLSDETSHIVHDANKIPNRKQDDIGNRLMGHCLTAYEQARVGNMIIAKTSKDQTRRESCAYKVESELGAQVAMINILKTLVPNNIGGTEWYRSWDRHALDAYYLSTKWRESEDIKLTKMKAAEKREQEKERERQKAINKRKQEIREHRKALEKEIASIEPKIIIKRIKNVEENKEEKRSCIETSSYNPKKKEDNREHRSNFARQ